MFEKRKNSDKRSGISWGFALILLLGGLFVGMNIGNSVEQDVSPVVSDAIIDVDISGEWIGTTTEDYGYEARYDYRVVINQTGNKISGMSYLDMADEPEIYSESPISGTIDGTGVFYTETSTLVLDNLSLDNWCLADTSVTYQVIDGQETLIGTWEVASHEREECAGIEGRVILTRNND